MWLHLAPIFDKFDILTIVYVGANTGAAALDLDAAFPGREFYLLEPVHPTFQALMANTQARANMHCLNIAAGQKDAWSTMFVDSCSPASSLLPYDPIALEEFPFLGKQVTMKVRVRALDAILHDCKVGSVDMLLMDVQGYENRVLAGAKRTLGQCKAVMTELSFQALYVGSATFDGIHRTLTREGFELSYLLNPISGASHRILQIDGVYVRNHG